MPTPSCRDLLSREIYDPVYDPLTGICYRNPCAAEEAGIVDWMPGCGATIPSYAIDTGPTWVEEAWWNDGGGRGRRRRRRSGHPLSPPGGGRFGPTLGPPMLRPGGGMKSSGGGGDLLPPMHSGPTMFGQASDPANRRMGGAGPVGPGLDVDRPTYSPHYGGQVMAPYAPSSVQLRTQPTSYVGTYRPAASSYQARPYAATMAPMRAASMQMRPQAVSASKGMRGLGQTPPTVPGVSAPCDTLMCRINTSPFNPIRAVRGVWFPEPSGNRFAGIGIALYRGIAVAGALGASYATSRRTRSAAKIVAAGVAGLVFAPMGLDAAVNAFRSRA
jgi:hypothetical protein